MQIVSQGLIQLFNHPNLAPELKPGVAFLIMQSVKVQPGLGHFIGFSTPQAAWLTREIDRYPSCAN